MSHVATQTTTPALKPHAIKRGAEHPIEKYGQTLHVSAGAELIKSLNPKETSADQRPKIPDPSTGHISAETRRLADLTNTPEPKNVGSINLGVDSDGSIQFNGKIQSDTASPGLDCANKSCAVCGGCGQNSDLVKIASGRQDIKEVNEAELNRNKTAILYAPPSSSTLIDYVNSVKDDFSVAKSINPPPSDQPVLLGQVQEDSASPHRSPVPPLIQTDPNFPTGKDPTAIPTPPPDPIGLKIAPAKSVDAVSPSPPPDVTAPTEPLRKPEDIVPASSKCPFKNLISAGHQAMQSLAEGVYRSVERLKDQLSTAVIVFSSQVGLTSINQEKLTRELESINNQNDKLGATEGVSYFSNGQRPEAQNGPKSSKIEDDVAAIRFNHTKVNHTTDEAETVSGKGGPPTVTHGQVAAKSSNTASQALSLSSTSGRLNQVEVAESRSSNKASQAFSLSSKSDRLNRLVAGFLSTLGQSFNEIKAAVSNLEKLAANPSSASAKQDPQIVNGQANSQNISSKAALAGSASFPQLQMAQKTSTSSPVNPIPSNSAAMPTNPVILSRASASKTNQIGQAPSPTSAEANLSKTANPRALTYKQKTSTSSPVNPIPSNSAAMPTNPVILSRASASKTNQIGQAQSPTSAEANLSKTANPRASNYNLSSRPDPLDARTTSYITPSPRRAAVARNLENLALKLPSSLSNRIAEVTNLRFALPRNFASTTFLNSSRRFAINASQANQLVRKLQAIAQSLMRASREPIKLFRTVKFNPNGQVPTATRLKSNRSVSEALARVASKIKSIIEPKRIDAAELIQKLNTKVLNLRQKILAAFKPLTSTLASSRSIKAISREVQASLSKKITQALPRLRFLVAQLTNLKARQASFQLNQASLRFRILASILTRNLNNSARSLRASARSLIIQAKLNLAFSTAQSLRRSLLARFFSLQRRLSAAKVNTARAIRFVSQKRSSEVALRAGLFQRKITVPSLRLSARTQKFPKLKPSQSWHKLLERVKLAGKTSQAKVSHFRKVLGSPQKVLNSLSSNAQPSSWQKLMLRKDLIVRFNSVAQRFLPLLLRVVNLITRSSYQHPFWFFLLELIQRKDKKKGWFKNNKVFLAQFLHIFSLILKHLNKAGRGVESLSPQELFALVRKALRKTFSQSAQQPQVVSANQAKGSKTIFAVNKSGTPDKNLSVFQAKI